MKAKTTAILLLVVALPVVPAWGSSPLNKSATFFGNVAIVALPEVSKPLPPIAVFNSPAAALAQVSTWCGTPSADNPCLIKIQPGVYDLAGQSLTMQPYVDIEGSGEATTIITSAFDSSASAGVVNGASHSELRFLTVRNTSTGYGVAIANDAQSPSITHVTAIVSGPRQLGCAVYNTASAPVLTHVTALAENARYVYGMQNVNGSTPVMTDITVTAQGGEGNYGIYNSGSSPRMNTVTATGKGYGASFQAYGIYNISSSAPVMHNVSATAIQGHFSTGMYNADSSPILKNVTVTAQGLNSHGMENTNASPTMTDVVITANAGTNQFGMSNIASSPIMTNVTVFTGAGPTGFSIMNSSSSVVLADRCTFEGGTSVSNTDSTMRIGGSKLIGFASSSGGTLSCAASYNGDYVALGPECR